MAKPTKAMHEGKQVDAEEMEYKVVTQPEVVLQVEDGTYLKIHIVLSKIVKVNNIYNQEGEPVYQVKWGTAVTASVPVALMKPPEAAKGSN